MRGLSRLDSPRFLGAEESLSILDRVYDKVHIYGWWSRSLLGEVRKVRRGPRVAALGGALEELGGGVLVDGRAGPAREGRREVVERVGVVAARGEA